MQLVLASTSAYRRELLSRLNLPFDCVAPNIDEAPLPAEPPSATALRLAQAKAEAVAQKFSDALIIGSDQVAHLNGRQFGKPGSRERAIAQLQLMSGQTVLFDTAAAVLNTQTQHCQVRCITTTVEFRTLSSREIEHYVDREPAYDCAGSAKIEGFGITLLRSLSCEDPTALIGLPLIALSDMLRQQGLTLP